MVRVWGWQTVRGRRLFLDLSRRCKGRKWLGSKHHLSPQTQNISESSLLRMRCFLRFIAAAKGALAALDCTDWNEYIRRQAWITLNASSLCTNGLCQQFADHFLFGVSNIIERQEDFRQDLFTACSNLFEVHHVHEGIPWQFRVSHDSTKPGTSMRGAECIFGVLNETTLRSEPWSHDFESLECQHSWMILDVHWSPAFESLERANLLMLSNAC